MNIVITGASRGIGFELAKQFCAEPSNNVIALARSEDKLEKLAKEINSKNFNYLAFDRSKSFIRFAL